MCSSYHCHHRRHTCYNNKSRRRQSMSILHCTSCMDIPVYRIANFSNSTSTYTNCKPSSQTCGLRSFTLQSILKSSMCMSCLHSTVASHGNCCYLCRNMSSLMSACLCRSSKIRPIEALRCCCSLSIHPRMIVSACKI
jgi:hypothetical protein